VAAAQQIGSFDCSKPITELGIYTVMMLFRLFRNVPVSGTGKSARKCLLLL
jgi:hypothetical protein